MSQLEYSPQRLHNKATLITGGTTGIGRATAILLAAQGARVFVFGRDKQALDDSLREIKKHAKDQSQVFGITADQSKAEDVRRIFKELDSNLGNIDILVNNAAESAESVTEMDDGAWRYVLETNLFGYIQCCREAIDRMKPKRAGHIINIGSMSAKSRSKGSDIYVASKSAIQGFSESLQKQVREEGIRVSLIEPGLVGTDMTAEKTPPEKQPAKIEAQEMLKAEDIAQCVLYVLEQPERCNVSHVRIQPLLEE